MVTSVLETTAIQSKREAKSFVPILQIYQPNTKQKCKETTKQPYRKLGTRKGVVVFALNGLNWFESITKDENIAALNTLWLGLVLCGKIKMGESGENKGRGRCKGKSERREE